MMEQTSTGSPAETSDVSAFATRDPFDPEKVAKLIEEMRDPYGDRMEVLEDWIDPLEPGVRIEVRSLVARLFENRRSDARVLRRLLQEIEDLTRRLNGADIALCDIGDVLGDGTDDWDRETEDHMMRPRSLVQRVRAARARCETAEDTIGRVKKRLDEREREAREGLARLDSEGPAGSGMGSSDQWMRRHAYEWDIAYCQDLRARLGAEPT